SIGYTLDEIANDITKATPAAFEPTLDYVVTKIPKFAFEKFRGADETLGTQMKSVGEAMAMGRTLKESFFKALRSMEASKPYRPWNLSREEMVKALKSPHDNRIRIVIAALEQGFRVEEVHRHTRIDPWFLDQFEQFATLQRELRGKKFETIDDDTLRRAKEYGFSDRRLADLTAASETSIRESRHKRGIVPVYNRVDTCAAEFESYTPYFYSTYEQEDESQPAEGRKVVILGSGPNRIGQGIEFDYCCCHASFALREAKVQSIMINCNPETVSTDYDTSDRLYFEPLTLEDVLEVIYKEKPEGVIVQFGGQTPLNLTKPLAEAGIKIMGTPADSVDLAEDRERFNALLDTLGVAYPPHGFATKVEDAIEVARKVGYPVLVRPSFVLGGRAMAIVYSENDLLAYVREAFDVAPTGNVLIDRFLEDAFEFDVDALADGKDCIIAGIMQHIEYAGVHSGDSTAVLPPYQISPELDKELRDTTRKLAKALKVVGLMNIQFAIAGNKVYVIEVNPRASRTVPFIAKASGVPLAKVATRLMLGESLASLGFTKDIEVDRFFVKAPVFPFVKFPGVDPRLSPEMKSTGEVMGIARDVGEAFYKAMLGAGTRLPKEGTVLVTVSDRDKKAVLPVAKRFHALGFKLAATAGTASFFRENGLEVREMLRLSEGRPNIDDAIRSGEIALIVNTPFGGTSFKDGSRMRSTAVQHNVPIITTIPGADAAALAITALKSGVVSTPLSLQEIYKHA
ncbi:MAG: carbamoyl-phosphate synthase large subunit, partial [Clostridia bacterium]|nr:carbamoyl-phosphate synthase large subunit [Deltaproteobacteria bacterium]